MSGEVIGLADYKNNPNNRPIVVKLESLGFNRAVGINKDTAAARDKVTVMVAGSDGIGYSRSSHEQFFLRVKCTVSQTGRDLVRN